jgi:hypothetical protein
VVWLAVYDASPRLAFLVAGAVCALPAVVVARAGAAAPARAEALG